MKVSVITINYNNIQGLKTTIQSVISQSYKDMEYIIVDGGSTRSEERRVGKECRSFSGIF